MLSCFPLDVPFDVALASPVPVPIVEPINTRLTPVGSIILSSIKSEVDSSTALQLPVHDGGYVCLTPQGWKTVLAVLSTEGDCCCWKTVLMKLKGDSSPVQTL